MQVSLSFTPNLSDTQHLAWIQRTFEEALKILGWPAYMPPAENTFFQITQMVFKGIAALHPSSANVLRLNTLFVDRWEGLVYKTPYPAEIYFIAVRLSQPEQKINDEWTVTLCPMKETVDAAKYLISHVTCILEAFRKCKEPSLDAFDKAWGDFLDQLIKERKENVSCWCGTLILSEIMDAISKSTAYERRQNQILDLARQIVLDDHSQVLLKGLNAEISSRLYKKIHQIHSKVMVSLINEAVAKHLFKITADEAINAELENMIRVNEMIFVDLILQLSAVFGNTPPLFDSVKDQLEIIQTELKSLLEKHPKTGLDSLLRRVLDSHIRLINKQYVPKDKDNPRLKKDLIESHIEDKLNAICLSIYFIHRKEMESITKSIFLDYRAVRMKPEMRIDELSQQIVELALKTFEHKMFLAGLSKEISLLV